MTENIGATGMKVPLGPITTSGVAEALDAWTRSIILRGLDYDHYRRLSLFRLLEPAEEKRESGVDQSFFDAFDLT